jgi:hypothetical protein
MTDGEKMKVITMLIQAVEGGSPAKGMRGMKVMATRK